MDIQTYINQNEDYLVQFKNLNLQYRNYNVLGLTLVKYKSNTIINDFTKLFKSIIIDQKTNKIISMAPMKSLKQDHNILLGNDMNISRIYDGTTVISGSDLVVTTGVGSEILTVSGTGSISSANVANNKSVTTGSLALSGSSGNASNYSIGTITINVTERPVNVSMEKVYDGSLNAPASALKSGGITNTVLGHTLSLSGIGLRFKK